jgi:D-glycero-beta-D-manno-heptose 1-phosphate adenylyltransferase
VAQIVSPEDLLQLRIEWRCKAMRVVVAMGAFDLLHPGHVRLLEQARSLGDLLVVAVEEDAAVRAGGEKEAKEPTRAASVRPVVPMAERAEILAALAAVDFVTELRNVSSEAWIERFQPDVYVQGGVRSPLMGAALYAPERTEGASWDTVNIPLEPGYSTTALIERIQQLRQ